ncbi:MAG: hypothetical protein ACTSXX_10920 [Candidatus Baldrarchaeia archaeon]
MVKVIKAKLEDILERPEEFLGKEVEVEGVLVYTGKTPRGPLYTVNLPEEDYCVGMLMSGGKRILCYGLENLCFDDYSNRRVSIVGVVKKLHDTIAIKVLSIKVAEPE